MKSIVCLLVLFFSFNVAKCQNLFPEDYSDCKIGNFSLEGGDVKAKFSQNLTQYFANVFPIEQLKNVRGVVMMQLLIDSTGKQCVRSIFYSNDCKNISRLNLRNVVNQMTGWQPATTANAPINVSITIRFDFNTSPVNVSYFHYNPFDGDNLSSVGKVKIENLNQVYVKNKTVKKIQVFNKGNSKIPFDMSRAICVDTNNIVWHCTDNGLVKIENGEMTVYDSTNSPFKPYKKQKHIMISYAAVDIHNSKWFSAGPLAYKYDGVTWQTFDEHNSPLSHITGIYADKNGNVWFKSSDGLKKFDGKEWSSIKMQNSKLSSDNISGVFADKKNRLWVGSYNGNNIMIDGDSITDLSQSESPLKNTSISRGYEDREGNIWFQLYDKKHEQGGMAKLSADNKWTTFTTKNSGLPANEVNYFIYDEDNKVLWVSINNVGIASYDGDQWSVFTPENSNIPSTAIYDMSFDRDGNIWCATFAGLAKIIFK